MWLSDFFSLFFPRTCLGCDDSLAQQEKIICTHCLYHLPLTVFHEDKDNPMCRQLWGRFVFSAAAALVYFRKGSAVQQIIHHLKYKNCPEAGAFLGELYGRKLLQSGNFSRADLIVPVPLHPRKEKKRGYNQSAHFAAGLSKGLGVPVAPFNLVKVTATGTQTKRSRFLRYQHMKDVFILKDHSLFAGKHMILADDVFTTGATAEACCNELLKSPGASVSILTIAYTE